MQNNTKNAARFGAMFSVASVLFGWHAGGGFATGNQANQFYVGSGWLGPISALLAILILTLTVRQAIIMYNQRGLTSYGQLFRELYHPFDKMEIVFEVYYYIMVLMATSSSIAGAGTLLEDAVGAPYLPAVLFVGVILLALTIFGTDLVRKASSVMSILILLCALTIFVVGIADKWDVIGTVYTNVGNTESLPQAVLKAFQYAGFQCASIPTMIVCGTVLKNEKESARAMWISFAMNTAALVLSVVMLLGWKDVYTAIEGGSTIPTLTICKELGIGGLIWAYYICLFLCFLSTGVSAIFGIAKRFENSTVLVKRVKNETARRLTVETAVMLVSMGISLAGLTNIVKYGYGYCGYIGIVMIIIPFMTVGVYKNRKYKNN